MVAARLNETVEVELACHLPCPASLWTRPDGRCDRADLAITAHRIEPGSLSPRFRLMSPMGYGLNRSMQHMH